jgi:hypothetical protein
MGWLYLGLDSGMSIWAGCLYVSIGVYVYGLAVSTSGLLNEDMGWLYLGQDRSLTVWAGVSRSGYGCEYMGWLNLGQDRSVMVWTGCILVSMGV